MYQISTSKVQGVKPDTRELATMLVWNRNLLLYGGLSHQAHPFIHRLDIATKTWRLGHPEEERPDHRFYRMGHSMVVVPQKLMVIFAGEIRDAALKHGALTNDIMYLLSHSEFTALRRKNGGWTSGREERLGLGREGITWLST